MAKRNSKNPDPKSEDAPAAPTITPPADAAPSDKPLPASAAEALGVKPGTVAFTSRFDSYRLTLKSGDAKRDPEMVVFCNGRADIADPDTVAAMRAHPLCGIEFHEVAAA